MSQSSRVNLRSRDEILSLRAKSVSKEGLDLTFLLAMQKRENTEAVVQYLKDLNLWTLALEWEDWSYLLGGEDENMPNDKTVQESYKDLGLLAIFPYIGIAAHKFLDELHSVGTQYMLFAVDSMIHVHEVEYDY